MEKEFNPVNKEKLLRLFRYLDDKSKISLLKIDPESIYYITPRDHATQICHIIINHISKLGMNINNIIITDATAGVGGDTISFAFVAKYVNAIEINKIRVEYLKNNIEIYNLKNVNVIHNDCLKALCNIEKHNVIYIDPPWGGKSYKRHKKLRLSIGDKSIEELCKYITDDTIMKCIPEIIVFKLPKNYDIEYLYRYIKKNIINAKIYKHYLKKMYIIVIVIKKP
uniref:RNA cap guanine-N2 methyltransferase n=1 Tax=Mimivirus LCMiAC01 TaxID=2506608 RepID=A0A481YZD0_9VIRU|nr:MAG: RNA cap guanine-N2 methyltransferase [Mimivirus LCMiAC01]